MVSTLRLINLFFTLIERKTKMAILGFYLVSSITLSSFQRTNVFSLSEPTVREKKEVLRNYSLKTKQTKSGQLI
jgi:hypothetical protein